MYNYRLTDVNGKTWGLISLETDTLPNLMSEGCDFRLGGSWNAQTKKFYEFILVPDPAVET